VPATTVASLKTALTRERRKNRRLRALITLLQDDLAETRRAVDLQVIRLAQIQAEVDLLKRRPS
jgi:hypothetical protein